MRNFYYVNSTEFENQDDPFLVMDAQELEPAKAKNLFPLRIELKARLSFEPILLRPIIQMKKTPQHPPLSGAVLYQTKSFFKSVSISLYPAGWSEFEQNIESFEESSSYCLDFSSSVFTKHFSFTKDSCVLSPNSAALPCGVLECKDPKDCMQWYCLPRTAGLCTALDWRSGQEFYGANKVASLKQTIECGEVNCYLLYNDYKQLYRSLHYNLKNNDLWIKFMIVKRSED
ncbi:hypothetical protein HE1_00496 [Holospora elegans E1]|uniref:Uncharacterized protein n=1 Tax=Holospora elegans E1 TaxID=1427503 RepID=A0A023DXM0_9PROT|nr:hypothetical protein [Holospora elegans]GAJ46171.1 hypothetical protein HE1_00496 [Holospora elegans E1]